MGSKPKPKRPPKRARYDDAAPLLVPGVVTKYVERRSRWRALSKPLEALAGAMPSYKLGRAGVTQRNVARVVLAGIALLLVAEGRAHLVWGVLGVLVAASLLVVPLAEHRKRRFIEWAARLRDPVMTPVSVPAELRWDGRKATITAEGRVWKSQRPRSPPAHVIIGEVGERTVLGLERPGDKPATGLWFAAPTAAIGPTFEPFAPSAGFLAAHLGDVMTVAGPDLARLLEAFWDAATGTVPAPPAPKPPHS
ncbi:MAG: hypothetical protein KC635_06060 [Myxococcales bacterium]|nr:hypothetical protein [Myxococcales bacterium]MCB9733611.1 hypothetical protein [Deltaproteobacteria bacterium]